MHVTSADQIRVIFHKEGQDQHPDVHTVVIRIGGHDDIVVTEVVEVVLHTKGGDEKVQFLVLGDSLPAFLVAVDRLSPKAENGLVFGVADLRYGSGSGVSLRDEYAGLLSHLFLSLGHLVAEMVAAVAELLVIDIGLLVALPGLLLNTGDLLALGLGLLDLVLYDRNDIKMDPEVVVEVAGHEIIDKRADSRTAVNLQRTVGVLYLFAVFVRLVFLPHVGGAELGLGLTLEVWLLDLDADRSYDALAAVLGLVVFLEIVLECLGYSLPESGEVGSSVAGVLAVYKG